MKNMGTAAFEKKKNQRRLSGNRREKVIENRAVGVVDNNHETCEDSQKIKYIRFSGFF